MFDYNDFFKDVAQSLWVKILANLSVFIAGVLVGGVFF